MRSVMALMQYALLVKEIPRAGWNKKFPKGHNCSNRKVKDAENVAGHMYGLAFLAMLVADTFKVNHLRLIEMALVHDLVETIATDLVTVTENGRIRTYLEQAKTKKEQEAIKLIARSGGSLGKHIRKLWVEFEAKITPEAKLLNQLDKLEMCFQAQCYHATKQKLNPNEFFGTSKPHITEPKLLALLSQLEKKCVENNGQIG